ncbi:MAG: transglutaminase domain-containing protein [archaeon]
MDYKNSIFFISFFILFLSPLLFASNETFLASNSLSHENNCTDFSKASCIYPKPDVVPPDPFNQQLIQMQLDELAKKKVKDFFKSVVPEFMQNEAEDKIKSEYEKALVEGSEAAEKALLNKYPQYANYIKGLSKTVGKAITWINIAASLKDAGDAFNDWVAVHSNPYATSQEKLDADIAFYDSGFSALSGMLPPGFSHTALAITKAGTVILQGSSEKGQLESQQWQAQQAQSSASLAQTMQSTWQTYGTNTQNKTLIASVMTDDQLVDHVLGTGVGPQGQPLQSTPDPSILNYVSDDKKKDIAKKIISKAANGQLSLTMQQAKQVISQFPIGSGFVIKNSPLYMVITDPFGRKFGVSPKTQDVLCEAEEVFCSAPFKNDELQLISTPSLFEGKYNIKLYGFADGEFTFSFTAFNTSEKIESMQDIKGFIKKGQILETDIELTSIGEEYGEDGFEVSEIKFEESSEAFDVPKNPLNVPFKVLSISPGNNSIFRTEKPIIEIGFNKPVAENNSPGFVTNSKGEEVAGMVLVDNTTLKFIPAMPLPEDKYFIKISGMKDKFGVLLSNDLSASFEVVRSIETGLKSALSKPMVYRITHKLHLENKDDSAVSAIKIKVPFPKDYAPNQFVKYEGSSIKPIETSEDSYGNIWALWYIDSLQAGEKKEIDSNFLVLVFNVNYFDYVDFNALTKSYYANDDFLSQFECVESDDSLVKSQAKEIVKGEENPYIIAQEEYAWVTKNIKYQYAGEGEAGGAIKTLQTKKGVCHGYSCLYTALLRASDVPAKYASVLALENNSAELHARTEFLLQDYGWLPVDSTWGLNVNDWFLNVEPRQVRMHEQFPPSYPSDWLSYAGENLDTGIELNYGIYGVLDYNSLWSSDLKALYDAAHAVDFKRELLNLMPQDIDLNQSLKPMFIADLNKEFNNVLVEYIYSPKPYAELSRSLDKELLSLQGAAEEYFQNKAVKGQTAALRGSTESIYSSLLNEMQGLLEQYSADFKQIAKDYEKKIKGIKKEFSVSLDFDLGIPSEETELKDDLAETKLLLESTNLLLKQKDYNAVEANLSAINGKLLGIANTEASLETFYLNQEQWIKDVYELNSEIVQGETGIAPEDVNMDELLTQLGVKLPEASSETTTSTPLTEEEYNYLLLLFAVFLICFVFWLLMLLDCLKQESFRHLNKIAWLFIIFFTLLLFSIGPLLYLLLEVLPRKKK